MQTARLGRYIGAVLLLIAFALSPTSILSTTTLAGVQSAAALPGQQSTPTPTQWSSPLGFRDEHTYAPHVVHDLVGNLVEDTRYGARNPDLEGETCFGVGFQYLYHSGEDLYRTDGASAAGAEVTAVADGTVVYADPSLSYPGMVIIVEHAPPGGRKIYSMYAHLNGYSLAVTPGQQVLRGQRLGTVMHQPYTGRFPQRHPSGDDSHLHFEMRYFMSGQDVYGPAYPACNGLIAGRGYTYRGPPDNFPTPGAG